MRDFRTGPTSRWITMWISGAMLLMVACVLNGYPFFFNDTRAYVRGPALALQAVVKRDIAADWQRGTDTPPAALQVDSQQQATSAKAENTGITANRSIYYGVLPFLGYLTGNFWLTALLQSAWLAASILLVIGNVFDHPSPIYYPCVVIVALLTAAGFYTGFLMPDVFTPIMILMTSLLVLCSDRLSRPAVIFITLSIAYALLAHPSHQVILLALTLVIVAWAWISHARDIHLGKPLLIIGGCLLVGLAGQMAFSKAIERFTGSKPLLLPHIEAHLIDMGPGTDYVKQRCDVARFAVCKYKDRFPMYWETFIGNPDPDKGVFAPADLDTKRRLSSEQVPFALAVFRFDPVGLTLGLAHDAMSQVFRFSLNDFVVDEAAMANYDGRFPPNIAHHIAQSAVHRFPGLIHGLSTLYTLVVIAALVLIVAIVARYRKAGRLAQHRDEIRLVGLLCTGVVVNAVVCGVLASPYDRFQARVIWLVVLAAGIMVGGYVYQGRGRAAADPGDSRARLP